MLIDPKTIRLIPDAPGSVLITWPSTHSDWPAWIVIDGAVVAGPLVEEAGVTTRSIPVAMLSTETHAIEVHELPSLDIAPNAIGCMPTTTPNISWTAPTGIDFYRVYHRTTVDGDDTRIFSDQVPTDEYGLCEILCPVELAGQGGAYNFLRVESVDEYDQESTRLSWVYWACAPDDPLPITIEAGTEAGTYDITLTE
jgi:hypothetical protein